MSDPGSEHRALLAEQAAVDPGQGLLKRVAVGVGAAATLGVLGVLGWTLLTPRDVPPPRVQPPPIPRILLTPPPPPPPPPKVDPPPSKPLVQEVPRPEPAPAPAPRPPTPASSAPKVAGPPALPLVPSGPGPVVNAPRCDVGCDGTRNGNGPGGGGGGGDAERYFQQQATQRVSEALRRDERTRGSNAQLAVTYDDAGRIVRVRLLRGTGNVERDRAIAETLTGLLVAKPPPSRRTLILELNENV